MAGSILNWQHVRRSILSPWIQCWVPLLALTIWSTCPSWGATTRRSSHRWVRSKRSSWNTSRTNPLTRQAIFSCSKKGLVSLAKNFSHCKFQNKSYFKLMSRLTIRQWKLGVFHKEAIGDIDAGLFHWRVWNCFQNSGFLYLLLSSPSWISGTNHYENY